MPGDESVEKNQILDSISWTDDPNERIAKLEKALYTEAREKLALAKQLQELQRKAANQKETIAELTRIADDAQRMIRERDSKVQELQALARQTPTPDADSERRIQELQVALEAAREVLSEQVTEAADAQKLEEQLEQLRQEQAGYQAQVDAFTREIEELKAAADAERRELAAEIEMLKARPPVPAADPRRGEFEEQVRRLVEENKLLQKKLEVKDAEALRLEGVADMAAANARAEAQEMIAKAQKSEAELLRLREETRRQAERLRQLEDSAGRIAELETELTESKVNSAEEVDKAKSAVVDLEAKIRELLQREGDLKRQLEEKEEIIDALEDSIEKQARKSDTQLVILQEQLETERVKGQVGRSTPAIRQIETLYEQIRKLTAERDELQGRMQGLNQTIANTKPLLMRAQQELNERQVRIEELEELLRRRAP